MSGKSRIAVAGATGRVGRHVVDVLTERDQEVVPISRSTGVDVISGEALAEALSGADAVVDVATGPRPTRRRRRSSSSPRLTTSRRSVRRPA